MDVARAACLAQGLYYLVTGLWPLLHMPSFLRVTGPKTDLWLVRTVAGLIVAVALALLLALARETPVREVQALAVASACALLAIDVVYVCKRVISPIYLADAAAELALIAAWIVSWMR
jgi:hypothetical protein